MAVLALALFNLVTEAALTPGVELRHFLYRVSHSLLALGGASLALGLLKERGGLGHSPILGRASLLFILLGPLVFCASWRLGLDEPDCLKFAGTGLLVYAIGCLFYWVSLGDSEKLAQIH